MNVRIIVLIKTDRVLHTVTNGNLLEGRSSLVEIDDAGWVLLFFNSNSKNGEVTSLALLNLLPSIVEALLKNLQ